MSLLAVIAILLGLILLSLRAFRAGLAYVVIAAGALLLTLATLGLILWLRSQP